MALFGVPVGGTYHYLCKEHVVGFSLSYAPLTIFGGFQVFWDPDLGRDHLPTFVISLNWIIVTFINVMNRTLLSSES